MPPLNKAKRIPPLNTLRLIPANDTLLAGYTNWTFDRGFFYEHIRSFFQSPASYCQKLMDIDKVTIYMDSLATHIDILIFDPESKLVATVVSALTPLDVVGGNVDAYYGDQFYTFIYQFTFQSLALPDGFYYVVVQEKYNGDADPLTDTLSVSECIQLRTEIEQLEKTLVFEYANDTNDYDVFWTPTSTPQPWLFRVEGILDMEPGSHVIAFQNMFWKNEKLQDIPFRVAILTIGGEGIPDWVWEKMNFILACDTFTINGERWYKENNASWTVKRATDFPMKSVSINLMNDPSVSTWEYNNSYDPDTFRIHDDTFDDTHD